MSGDSQYICATHNWLGDAPCPSCEKSFCQQDIPSNKRELLYGLHAVTCAEALSLMRKKNEDYATDADPYVNFHAFGRLGIIVRLSDKLARLKRFEERGKFSVADEGVRDTALDIINYVILYLGYTNS